MRSGGIEVSGWGAASRTRRRLSLTWERSAAKRSVPAVRRRRDQLPSLDGCPAAGVVSSGSLNGAQREKDLNTPTRWTGPGTRDLNTPSIRPALPAESNLKSAAAAFPRGRPSGEQPQIRQVMPGQQGPCPRDFYGGKPRKSQTMQLVSPDSMPIFQTLRGQSPKSFNPVHKKFNKTYTKIY